MGKFLERPKAPYHFAFKMIRTLYSEPTHSVMLEMTPYQLIGVQVRRIGRQMKQTQTPLGLRHEFLDLARTMHWMPVNNQKHRILCLVHQPLQEINEYRCRQFA